MRIALHSEIQPGLIDGYVANHETIPDDLVETFSRIGIHSWTIWRSDHRLFHLVECDDWDAARAALANDAADARWQATIGPYVRYFLDAEGGQETAPLHEVWDLNAQRDRSREEG